jgi:hypothetical protein
MENDEREAYDMPRQEYSDKGYVIVDGSTTSTSTPTKKKRKPMGLLQKQAFVERMKKAREAKLTK